MNLKKIFTAMLLIGMGFNCDLFAPRADGARRPARVPEAAYTAPARDDDARQVGRPVEEEEVRRFPPDLKVLKSLLKTKCPQNADLDRKNMFKKRILEWLAQCMLVEHLDGRGEVEKQAHYVQMVYVGGDAPVLLEEEFINVLFDATTKNYFMVAFNRRTKSERVVGEVTHFYGIPDPRQARRMIYQIRIILPHGEDRTIQLEAVGM